MLLTHSLLWCGNNHAMCSPSLVLALLAIAWTMNIEFKQSDISLGWDRFSSFACSKWSQHIHMGIDRSSMRCCLSRRCWPFSWAKDSSSIIYNLYRKEKMDTVQTLRVDRADSFILSSAHQNVHDADEKTRELYVCLVLHQLYVCTCKKINNSHSSCQWGAEGS
jgi:hypothetical protein